MSLLIRSVRAMRGTDYDKLGRRDWSNDGAGRVTTYGYDASGRPTDVTDQLGSITRYRYDGDRSARAAAARAAAGAQG